MSDYSLIKTLLGAAGVGDDGTPPEPVKQQIINVKKSDGTDFASIAKVSQAISDVITQNQEKLTYEHSLVTNGGIYFPDTAGAQGTFQYTPFTQDPFRQSMGSMFIKYGTEGLVDVARFSPAPFNYKWNSGKNTNPNIPTSNIKEDYKYLTPKNYYNANITNFTVTSKQRYVDNDVPIYNFRDVHHIKIYYGLQNSNTDPSTKNSIGGEGNATFQKLKLDLLSLFFTVDQKKEGYSFNVSNYGKAGTLNFLSPGSALAYDAVISDENNEIIDALTPNLSEPIGYDEEGNPIYGTVPQDASDGGTATNQNPGLASVIKSISSDVLTDIENKIYYDHTFKMDTAISEEAVPLYGEELGQNTLIADIKPVYNFFSRKYEEANIPETAAANIYINPKKPAQANLILQSPGKPTVYVSVFDFEKYASTVINNCIDKEILAKGPHSRKNSIVVFDSESKLMRNRAEDAKEQFPFYNTIQFKPDSNRAVSSMMRQHGIMGDFIKTLITKLYGPRDFGVKYGIQAPVETTGIQLGFAISGILIPNQQFSVISRLKDPASIDFFAKEDETYVRALPFNQYDFSKWLEYYITELKDPPTGDSVFTLFNDSYVNTLSRFFINEKSDLQPSSGSKTKFEKMINMLMFLPKYKNFIEQNTRTYADLLSAGKCYSETLFYRVEKRDQDGNVVQQIFLTKPEQGDVVKYIDTQIQYGKKYEYSIFSYQMVIGSKYRYLFANNRPSQVDPFDTDVLAQQDENGPYFPYAGMNIFSRENGLQFSVYSKTQTIAGQTVPVDAKLSIFTALMEPDVRIIEVPYHKESDVLVLDSPPLSPVVNFAPIHERKNDILISFETQTGDIEQEPISILDEDDKFFEVERIQQKRTLQYNTGEGTNGLYSPETKYVFPRLRFKSDDFSSEYQVFRITKTKPKDYTDFKGNLYQTLDVNERTAFIDKVQTNVKYYYTFRSKDLHGNISNPSPVYEFEMVENSGVAYPVISIVDMKSEESKIYTMSKSLNRYLQIDAAAIQSYLNEEKSGLNGTTAVNETIDPVLGYADSSLWNQKRFKVRLRSRSTGKAIDLNIGFKTRHDKQSSQNTELCD